MDVDHFCILIQFLSLFYILVLTILNSSNKLFWTRERDVDVVAGSIPPWPSALVVGNRSSYIYVFV